MRRPGHFMNLPRIEVLDEEMVHTLRRMSPQERLHVAVGLYESARQMLIAHLASEHPDWAPQQIEMQAAKRLAHESS